MKSSFTVQEQFKYILRDVKLDKFVRTDILEMTLKTAFMNFSRIIILKICPI